MLLKPTPLDLLARISNSSPTPVCACPNMSICDKIKLKFRKRKDTEVAEAESNTSLSSLIGQTRRLSCELTSTHLSKDCGWYITSISLPASDLGHPVAHILLQNVEPARSSARLLNLPTYIRKNLHQISGALVTSLLYLICLLLLSFPCECFSKSRTSCNPCNVVTLYELLKTSCTRMLHYLYSMRTRERRARVFASQDITRPQP